MKKYITDENKGISYTLVGDVYIPNLVSTDTNYEIGCWGSILSNINRRFIQPFLLNVN